MEIDHLGPEAIAALVDGELTPRAAERARIHLVNCEDCRREVLAQREVAQTMRSAMAQQEQEASVARHAGQGLPAALLSRLAAIPESFGEDAGSQPSESGPRADGGASSRTARSKRGEKRLNFDIAGRRFPRTLADKIELFIHQLRGPRRS